MISLKDEIKEVLDKLKKQHSIDIKLGKEIANDFAEYKLNYKEMTLLLNYITNLQKEKETFKLRLEKAVRIIDKFKETYIICFDKDLWGFVKRLEKCLTGSGKNEN